MPRIVTVRRSIARASILACHAAVLAANPGSARQAQPVRPITLDRPDAVAPEPFSLIRGAVELRDGRLLVSDWIEQRIAIIDFGKATIRDRGRVGAGPAEFRLPAALFRFRGDSALLVDVGNARLAVLGPDGSIRRTFTPPDPAALSPGDVDADGRIWYVVPPWRASRRLGGDSVELKVYDPATGSSREVARLHGSTPVVGPSMEPRVPFVIFAPQDGFAVSPNGRLAIVRAGDYSVHWHGNDAPVDGPPIAVAPVRPTDRDRAAYVRQFVQSSPMSGRGEDGALGHAPAELAADPAVQRMVRASAFAEFLPPFRAGELRVDARGRLWVGRHDPITEARRYDVFDEAGRRITEIRLGPGRRLIALGAGHAYVARTDDDGLQHVERYPLTAVPSSR